MASQGVVGADARGACAGGGPLPAPSAGGGIVADAPQCATESASEGKLPGAPEVCAEVLSARSAHPPFQGCANFAEPAWDDFPGRTKQQLSGQCSGFTVDCSRPLQALASYKTRDLDSR